MKKIFQAYFILISIRACVTLLAFFYVLNFQKEIPVSLFSFMAHLFLGIVGTVNNFYLGMMFDVLLVRSSKFLRVFPVVYFVMLILVELKWGERSWLSLSLIIIHGIIILSLYSFIKKEKNQSNLDVSKQLIRSHILES